MGDAAVNFGIRISRNLATALETAAKERGLSRSELIAQLLREALAPRIALATLVEESRTEADTAVVPKLAVVETALQQVLGRISAVENALKNLQDELAALESNENIDPVTRARQRSAIRRDLDALTEALSEERASLDRLRKQRLELLQERNQLFAQALRARLEAWVAAEGGRIAAAVADFLTGLLSALRTTLVLDTRAAEVTALRFLWYDFLTALAERCTDEAVKIWVTQMLPLSQWDWQKSLSLTFEDFSIKLPWDEHGQHTVDSSAVSGGTQAGGENVHDAACF